jgi:hypothetical protein
MSTRYDRGHDDKFNERQTERAWPQFSSIALNFFLAVSFPPDFVEIGPLDMAMSPTQVAGDEAADRVWI